MTELDFHFRSRGKTLTIFLNGDINDELTKSAKAGKRSKSKEMLLRLKHHLELFPEFPQDALSDIY